MKTWRISSLQKEILLPFTCQPLWRIRVWIHKSHLCGYESLQTPWNDDDLGRTYAANKCWRALSFIHGIGTRNIPTQSIFANSTIHSIPSIYHRIAHKRNVLTLTTTTLSFDPQLKQSINPILKNPEGVRHCKILLVQIALKAPIPLRSRLRHSELGEEFSQRPRRSRPFYLLQRIHKLLYRHIAPLHLSSVSSQIPPLNPNTRSINNLQSPISTKSTSQESNPALLASTLTHRLTTLSQPSQTLTLAFPDVALLFWHARCDPGRSGGCLRDGAGAATNSCAWVSRSRDLIGGGGAGEDGNGHSREEREERFTVRVWACAARLRSTLRLTGGPMFSLSLSFNSSFLFIL